MNELAVDLHVHLGSSRGHPVKIGASPALTLQALLDAGRGTGMDVLGVVDSQASGPWSELQAMLADGRLKEEPGGGFSTGEVLLIPGAEIQCQGAHFLCYLPEREGLGWMASLYEREAKNPGLSTGVLPLAPARLRENVEAAGGVFVPAHVFTPYCGFYGRGMSMDGVFEGRPPFLAEMGLSADTLIAGPVAGLRRVTLLASSDAHSLPMIGREHTAVRCRIRDFRSIVDALLGRHGEVAGYMGLDPRLGKYYLTGCPRCGRVVETGFVPGSSCSDCGAARMIRGVRDTARGLGGTGDPPPRAPYLYGTPLEWLPGVGAATRERLVGLFGSGWNVLHSVPLPEIERTAGARAAGVICGFRAGSVSVRPGGGGRYGKLIFPPPTA